jgi:hypothetical protein
VLRKSCVVPVHAMQAYRGRRRIPPLIFNLGLEFQPPAALPRRKRRQDIPNKTVEESHSRRFGQEKNLLPLPGIDPRLVQPVAVSIRTRLFAVHCYCLYLLSARCQYLVMSLPPELVVARLAGCRLGATDGMQEM